MTTVSARPSARRVLAATTTPVTLLAARPRYGLLVHAVIDNPTWRDQMGVGRLVMYTRPVCRPSSRPARGQHMPVGGHLAPTPVVEALAQATSPCPTCQGIVADLDARGLLAAIPAVPTTGRAAA